MKEALIIIDYQYDFVDPKGSLYVKDAETKKDYILKLINQFKKENNLIIGSKDWHPNDHYSFKEWGAHCVQNTIGANLMYDESLLDKLIIKGQNKEIESYSAFYDEKGNSNGLHEYLQKNKINKLTLVGVATDVCVANTLTDGLKLWYKIDLDLNGCAGITNIIKFR